LQATEIDGYSDKCEALVVGRYAKRREDHYLDVQDRIEEIERTRGDLAIKEEPEVASAKAQRLAKRSAYADPALARSHLVYASSALR
jgi:hypothetical protein